MKLEKIAEAGLGIGLCLVTLPDAPEFGVPVGLLMLADAFGVKL